jgi:predicted nucleotidyltransferase
MTKEDILKVLKEKKEFLQEKYQVKKIGLFGSYVRDEATDKSDIDIYAVFPEANWHNTAGLWNYLENIYGKKVDLLREYEKGVKQKPSAIKEEILKEVIFI